MTYQHFILFDIDGTLLTTGGAGSTALKHALIDVYGSAGPIDSYDMGGRTIREIVRDLLSAAGTPPDEIWAGFNTFKQRWAEELRRIIPSYDVTVHPGTKELVRALDARPDALVGILTANTRDTAAIKLEAAGFDLSHFKANAYGDVSLKRADLVPEAVQAARDDHGAHFAPERVVHIGDAPNDVACAHAHDARAIAVLTGGKPRAVLAGANPEYIFEDLSNIKAVMDAIVS